MVTKIKHSATNISNSLIAFFGSKTFFKIIIALALIQGFWYALSFQPTIYDEGRHIGVIGAYTKQYSPFIGSQDPVYDVHGEITRDASYMFYYLMSWPARLVTALGLGSYSQTLLLRIICIMFFAAGLVFYRRIFIMLSQSNLASNLAILFIVLTPSIAPLPGAINYDNLIFLLSGVAIFLAIKIISNKRVDATSLFWLLAVSLFGSLIKYSFIALIAPLFLILVLILIRKFTFGHTLKSIRHSFLKVTTLKKIVIVSTLILLTALFIERPVLNTLKYGNPAVSCTQIISVDRCVKNYTAKRNVLVMQSKPADFKPLNPYEYGANFWVSGIINTQVRLLPWRDPMPIMKLIYINATFLGFCLILIYLRDYLRPDAGKLLIFVMVGFTLFLFFTNYGSYKKSALPLAVTSRYLLPVMPIFIYYTALSFKRLFSDIKIVGVVSLCLCLLIFTQGGSIITHLTTVDERLFVTNKTIRDFNLVLRRNIDPITKSN